MKTQVALLDLREETRPLRKVVAARQTTETKWSLLLECGHACEVIHTQANVERKRCTKCGAFGDDVDGLKYRLPTTQEAST